MVSCPFLQCIQLKEAAKELQTASDARQINMLNVYNLGVHTPRYENPYLGGGGRELRRHGQVPGPVLRTLPSVSH